ncbi:DNA helicase [Fusarium longipes]|uniref:DNA helicase n=1 Tax=Fusarium longipes TaxID=694270 RepID=A0A395RCA1_9HYPO|nr:DNA helicase [Fusarium longipes]
MQRIVSKAALICTTSMAAAQKPYKVFRQLAKAVMIDEGGTMTLAEGLYVLFTMQKEGNNYLNAFPQHCRLSTLDYFKRTSVACFVLNEQLRIADGQFDIAQELIYHDVVGFKYGPKSSVANHEIGREIESWAVSAFIDLEPSNDKLYAQCNKAFDLAIDLTANTKITQKMLARFRRHKRVADGRWDGPDDAADDWGAATTTQAGDGSWRTTAAPIQAEEGSGDSASSAVPTW